MKNETNDEPNNTGAHTIRCGVRTEVRDRRTGATFTQLCVGRMSDRAIPCPWPPSGGTIGDRIVFTHSPIVHHKGEDKSQKNPPDATARLPRESGITSSVSVGKSSFGMVTVLSEPLEANISASLVFAPNNQSTDPSYIEADGGEGGEMQNGTAPGHTDELQEQRQQSENGPTIILGPVVGRVEVVAQCGIIRESCCVPVVLEVDREGEVVCVVSFESSRTRWFRDDYCRRANLFAAARHAHAFKCMEAR